MSIFAKLAPHYFAAHLPVIPLAKWNDPGSGAGKRPILKEWNQYSLVEVAKAVQDHWIDSYPDNNIGITFGPASGLCAIDIDSDDPEIVQAILACLPKSPWKRVGQKGMGLAFKFSGQKNFKLRDTNNNSVVEFLGTGNQMALSGSIHPKTGKPYVSDTNLWEVLDQIPELPADIEKVLRAALEPVMGTRGLTLAHTGRSKPLQVVPQGERDIQLVRHAGYLARVVMGIDKSEKFTLAAAIAHMFHWVEEYTASISGDSMDPDKGTAKLLEFLLRDMENGKTLPDGWDVGLTTEQREHPAIASMLVSNEVARWTVTKAREWLTAKIAEYPNDDNAALAQCQALIKLVAADGNFTDFEFGALIPDIQRVVGKNLKLTKPDLKILFRESRNGSLSTDDTGDDHEEIARYVVEHIERSGEILWNQGFFWQWNGSCYKQLTDDNVYIAIAEGVKGNNLARRHNDYAAVTKTISKLVHKDMGLGAEHGVNFANGFLNMDLELVDHSPRFGRTYTMGFDYVPARAGECHKWLEFLEGVWGDDEDYADKVKALQEVFAATMFGIGTRYQRAILLYGRAGAGKSVALNVLQEMMPVDAVCTIPPHLWGTPFVLPAMVGKTLNICGELPESKRIEGNTFKEVVEGSTQSCEQKMQNRFEFKPIATQMFASNCLPTTRDTSKGFTRRWLILDFNKTVAPENMIPDYAEVLVADEREAIAAWAVQGLERLIENKGYTIPSSHNMRIAQVARINNTVQAWLDDSEKIRPDPGSVADARECYDQYALYLREESRGSPRTFEHFKLMVEEIGYDCDTYHDPMGVRKYQFRGLKVITPTVESKWGQPASYSDALVTQ